MIKRIVKTLRPIRSGIITVNGVEYSVEPEIPEDIHPPAYYKNWGQGTNLRKSGKSGGDSSIRKSPTIIILRPLMNLEEPV